MLFYYNPLTGLLEPIAYDASLFQRYGKNTIIRNLTEGLFEELLNDEVIFEEFKGTGNSETVLDRKIADKRIYPAIDITKSGTRREELLFDKNDLQKMNVLRRIIAPMGTMDAIEFISSKLKDTKNNSDFFNSMNKPT